MSKKITLDELLVLHGDDGLTLTAMVADIEDRWDEDAIAEDRPLFRYPDADLIGASLCSTLVLDRGGEPVDFRADMDSIFEPEDHQHEAFRNLTIGNVSELMKSLAREIT